MTYLQNKKLTFMSIVNRIKGFVRSVSSIPPLILSDCVDENSLISYSISGNSIQNGTPSPDAPVEVESVGEYDEKTGKYKIPVVCSGNNMLNPEWLELGSVYDHNGATGNSTTRVRTKLIPLDAGKYYMRIYPYNNLSLRLRGIHIYNYDTEQWESYTAWSSVQIKYFTISALSKVRFVFQTPYNDVIIVNDVIGGNPMLALSDTAVDYEPYIEPVTTNIYLDEPLRKVREYGDYLDFDKCTHIKNIGYVKNPIIQQVMSAESLQTRFLLNSTLTGTNILNSSVQMTHGINRGYANDSQPFTVQAANNRLYYYILNTLTGISSEDSNTVRVEKASAWLSGKDVEVVYIFKKPIETPITIPKLPTFRGTTIYTIKTSVQPSDMSATYYATSKE